MTRRRRNKRSNRAGSRGGTRRRRRRRCFGKYGESINPFFNFLPSLKEKYKGLPARALTAEGARIWRAMSCEQKQPYVKTACEAQEKCRKGRKNNRITSERNKYLCNRKKSGSKTFFHNFSKINCTLI